MNQLSHVVNIKSDFTLMELMKKCPYDAEDMESIKQDLKRCFVAIDSVPEIFVFKQYDAVRDVYKVAYSNLTDARSKLSKIVMYDSTFSKKIIPTSAWQVYLDNTLYFTFSGLSFYSMNPNVFSYFRGYDYDVMRNIDMSVIQPFLDHIHGIIADGKDEVYTYIISWIATILKNPASKTGTALVILGAQGTGKNTFFTDIICKLISRYAAKNVTSIDDVVGKFNSILENKKLVVLNELQSIDSNKYLNSDALKSLITDDSIVINEKNEPKRETQNVANFIFVSNNAQPIRIDDGDRRYCVTKTSMKHMQDFEYFEKLSNGFTEEFYGTLFTFFMTLDISKFNVRKIPETESKNSIKEASESSYDLFIKECYEDIYNITGPSLYDLYRAFVAINGFAGCSSRTLITNIKEYTGEAKTKWLFGKAVKVYNLKDEYRRKFDAMKKAAEAEAKINGHVLHEGESIIELDEVLPMNLDF